VLQVHELLSLEHQQQQPSLLDVNFTSRALFLRTPLHVACEEEHLEIIALLLAHPQINVNARSMGGATPFLSIYSTGAVSSDVVRLLLADPRVDVDLPDHDGFTPVWWIAMSGSYQTLRWLVASGRRFDHQTPGTLRTGEVLTPLEIAQKEKKFLIVKLLEGYHWHPEAVTHRVRLDLGIQEAQVAELFAHVVFVCDEYLTVVPQQQQQQQQQQSPPAVTVKGQWKERGMGVEKDKEREAVRQEKMKAARFFMLVSRLPMELQMVVCNLAHDSPRLSVLTQESERAFKSLALVGYFWL